MPSERVRVGSDQFVECRANLIVPRKKRSPADEHCKPGDTANPCRNRAAGRGAAGHAVRAVNRNDVVGCINGVNLPPSTGAFACDTVPYPGRRVIGPDQLERVETREVTYYIGR